MASPASPAHVPRGRPPPVRAVFRAVEVATERVTSANDRASTTGMGARGPNATMPRRGRRGIVSDPASAGDKAGDKGTTGLLSAVVGGALTRGRERGGHRQTAIPGFPLPSYPAGSESQTTRLKIFLPGGPGGSGETGSCRLRRSNAAGAVRAPRGSSRR